jgi:cobalt-zinc-cadmium efflux system protein
MPAHPHHDHDHDHDHGGHAPHRHGPATYDRAFLIGITLNTGFVIAEAVYGLLANSLALLADAGHNLGDVLGLLLAWAAASLAKRQPSARFTYGMKRTPILASLANAMLLLLASGAIVFEAVQRLKAPAPVDETTVIWVAFIGILINGVTALGFMAGRKSDLNIRGAFLHMVADAVVSLGVVLSGLAVLYTGWLWIDPAVSIVVALVIVVGTWSLLKEAISLSLDAVPASVDRQAIETYLAGLPGVSEVHDLHIWAMSTTDVALTVHLVRPGATLDDGLLAQACRDLSSRFGVAHATLQVESGDPAHPCTLAPSEVV